MQSYCIYAEAFAGPFRPLRAPEPPFTHKTPPFTQVLFLFDAFYGTISLRKPSSLCSYKTESEAPMKKRILALLLAFSMMLSLLPVSALADTGGGIGSAGYTSNGSLPNLVMDNNTGKPDLSRATQISERVYQGNGWKYDKNSDALMLNSGKYDFNYTVPRFDGSEHYDDCDHLNCVNVNHIVVQPDATIVGGMFNEQSLVNHGTVTNGLFKGTSVTNHGTLNCLFPPNSDNSKPTGIGTIECHSLTAADNSTVEVLLYSSTFGNTTTTYSEGTFYFTGTPTLEVKLSSNEEITCINGEKLYGGLTKPDWKGYQTFTPKAGEDVVLSSSETTASALEMNYNGWPKTDNMTPINNVYYGDGWKYENGTLTLKSGEYDFNYTKPKDTASERYSYTVECNVVVNKGAAITGGKFSGDTFSNSGTVKDVLIKEGQITNTGTLSCLFGLLPPSGTGFTRHTMTAVDGSKIYYTVNQHLSIGGVYKLYFTGTPKFTVRLENSTIHYINGEEHYGGLTSPDGKGYQTFTPQIEEDIVLNREPYATDLVITEGGIPDTTGREPIYDSANNVIGCKGEGWKYENDTLTLESGSYDFSKNGLGQLAPDVKLVVGPSVTLTGGVFNEKPDGLTTDNVQTIILNGSDSIVAVNGLSSAKWNTTLYAIKDSQVEIKADTDITNINGWDIGKFPGGSSYPNGEDDKKTVSFQMPDGPVVLNDTLYTLDIIRGTMWGNTSVAVPAGTELPLVADEPKENETFLGWTLSDESLLKDGTLNDPECKTITIKMKAAGATAEAVFQKDTPAYTLTVTGGGLVNGKTSAVVEAGDEVRLTVGEGQDSMSFNYWDLPTALTKALMAEDSTFSNKVENLTFIMPDLSEYTEDTRFTIRLDIRPAELPDDDDGPSVLGTMATVAVGGAAAGILVWQGVSLGVDSYLQLSLPDGVPVPANRRELVKLLWETAGKPDVVLPALYGDVSTEDGELQKATRWAIDNGLVKPADEGNASRFDPDRSVSKYEVARAWFKVQQMLK